MLVLLKKIIACLLLLAFAVQTFNRVVMVFDYQVNTQSYRKDCENKARPQMHCNGQCKLMKKLKKEAEKDQKNPERKAENNNEIVVFTQVFTPANRVAIILPAATFVAFTMGNEIKMPRSVLHPPC